MDNEMIERCTNAVRLAIEADCDDKGIALACIKAMREPTGNMLEAGLEQCFVEDSPSSIFIAMIDAIINE
jgi:hypothetical protein